MSKRTILIAIALIVLGIKVCGSLFTAMAHPANVAPTAAMTISPGDITRDAGQLPVTVVDAYI